MFYMKKEINKKKLIILILISLSIIFTLVSLGLMAGVIANNHNFSKYTMLNALYGTATIALLSIISLITFLIFKKNNSNKERKIKFYILLIIVSILTLIIIGLTIAFVISNNYNILYSLGIFLIIDFIAIIEFLIFPIFIKNKKELKENNLNKFKIKKEKKKKLMEKERKIFYLFIILTVIFTLIIFGLLGGVLSNNYYYEDYYRWIHCRNAMFAFVALDSISILGLILFPIFKSNNSIKEKKELEDNEIKNNINNLTEIKESTNLKTINVNLIKEINKLKENINSLKINQENILPIGTILISTVSPKIGKWTDLGELKNGQALLGGDSSNGELISLNNELKVNKNIILPYNQINIKTNNKLGYQLKTKNIAYGIGIGKGFHIWRKDS